VRDERGAFIIIWALLAIALFAMVAIVVDLGQLRTARRNNQSVADLAALAAGQNLGNGRPQQACADAWSYLLSNVGDMPAGATSPCGSVPTACPSPVPVLASRTYTTTANPFTVTITYPVTDADIADPKFGGVGSNDGQVCQRMRVSIKRSLTAFFAGVVNQRNLSTSASAVVRSNRSVPTDKPSLWLLEPAKCQSLTTSGSGSIEVGSTTPPKPGFITVDSAGTGAGCGSTIESGGSSHIYALPASGTPSGIIALFALPLNATCNDAPTACSQGDISSGKISPAPVNRVTRATRSPVDWQFNCKSDNDGNDATSIYPDYRSVPLVPIPDCPESSIRDPYMDQLRTTVKTTVGQVPGGGTWTTWSPTQSCSPGVGTLTVTTGNWYVNCPAGFNVGNNTTVEINGNVVFDGPVSVGNGGTLRINTANTNTTMANTSTTCAPADPTETPPKLCAGSSSQKAAYVFMRNGNLDVRQNLTLMKTMLYQHNGYINIIAGAVPIWTSPDEGAFTGLSFWNEKPSSSATDFQLLGGGTMQLEGTFFTPEAAPLRLRGGGLQNALQAQFISNSLDVGGNGVLSLDPLTNKGVAISTPTGVLIR
jgi:hypothetical protein